MTLKEFNKTKRLKSEDWISKAKKVHGDKFDYSNTVYTTAKNKLKIICPIHGEQEMLPHHHIKGYGCPSCGKKQININNGKQLTQEQFIERIKHIEGLTFEKTVYKNKRSKVTVTCKIHGDYTTKAEVLLKGCGCPNCKTSNGESIIENWLKENNLIYFKQMSFPGCVFKSKLKFDFYIPSYNVCIEYDSKQHFSTINYWGGKKGLDLRKKRDAIKTNFCLENNINLLRISYLCDIKKKLKLFFNIKIK